MRILPRAGQPAILSDHNVACVRPGLMLGLGFFLVGGVTEANAWSHFDVWQHDLDMIYGLVCWGHSVITKCFSDQSCQSL